MNFRRNMDRSLIKCYILFVFLTLINAQESANADHHYSRKSNRIVKVYSGSRPAVINCTNEGFQADPHDCGSFYRCMKSGNGKYTAFKFQCGPGTVYDPDIEVCNHPQNTKRSECGSFIKPHEQSNEISEEIQELPSPITTVQPVYINNPVASQSTSTQIDYYDLIQESSYGEPSQTRPKNTSSTTGIIIPSTSTTTASQTSSTKYLTTLKEMFPSSTTSLYETSTKRLSSIPPLSILESNVHSEVDKCTFDGFMGDSINCQKFYRCVGNQKGGFIRYEFSCSESTVWDEELQSCNHPWAVKRSRCNKKNSSDILNPSSTSPSLLSTTQKEKELSEENGVEDTNIQDYFQKYNSSELDQTQPQYSYGNVEEDKTEKNYGYVTNIASSKFTQMPSISSSTASPTTIENKFNIDSTTNRQYLVTGKHNSSSPTKLVPDNNCKESGFLRDKYDCRKFYRCVDNGNGSYNRYEYFCGDGTVWDSKIESCNHAWAVNDCHSSEGIESSLDNIIVATTPTLASIKTSTLISTQSLYSTSPNTLVENETESKGTVYGSSVLQSSTTTQAPSVNLMQTTGSMPYSASDCISDGFIGDKENCKIFYRCIHNGNGKYTKLEFKCGDGTVWDSAIGSCNHQWAVKNCGGATLHEFNKTESSIMSTISLTITTLPPSFVTLAIESEDTNNNIDQGSGYDISTKEPIYSSSLKTTIKPTEPYNNSHVNECKHSGFMSDKNDCKKFYRCVDNGNGSFTRYEFTCGLGTLWDPKIEGCNYAQAVKSCSYEETSTNYPTTSSITSTIFNKETTNQTDIIVSTNKEPDSTTSINLSSSTVLSTTTKFNFSECKTSGFIGDFKNCKKFYRCIDNGDGSFTKYEFQCGEGTVWDQRNELCNHEWAVEKCGSNTYDDDFVTTLSPKPIVDDKEIVTSGYPKENQTQISETQSTQTNLDLHSSSIGPDISNTSICKQSGFMGDRSDCKKYYRCIDDGQGNYIRYEFICGEGTVWDKKIEACNHVWAVKQCGTGEIAVTDDIENITQGTTTKIIKETVISHTTEKITTTYTINTSDQITQEPQSICQTEGFYGNPYNCKKFYRCVDDGKSGFIKYEFMCGDGTFWNNEIQSCDHEYYSHKCSQNSENSSTDKSTSPVMVSSSSTTLSLSQEHNTHSVETSSQPNMFKCSADGFYANPVDCKKFIRCVNNGKGDFTRYDFTCGEGTIWVQEIQACDHEDQSESCKSQIQSTGHTQISEDFGSSTKKQEHSTSAAITTSPQSLTVEDEYTTEKHPILTTNDICFKEGFYGSKYNCRKFYRCVDNGNKGFDKYEFTCGEGTAWDDNIKACNHELEVMNCKNNNEGQIETIPVYHDEGNQQLTSTTTTEESHSTESTTQEIISINHEDSCKSEGYFGNTDDCKKFYRCVSDGSGGYTKYEYTCGDGTIWDQDIKTCNHPKDVENLSCKENQNIEHNSSSTTSSSFSTSSSPTSILTSSSSAVTTTASSSTTTTNESMEYVSDNTVNPSNCSQEVTSSKPQNSNITCEKAGYYSDLNDCKKFYRCVDWDGDGTRYSVYHFTCGEGTIWDPALETCNHKESVYPPRDCSGAQSHTDNNTMTTESNTNSTTTQVTTEPVNITEPTTTDSVTTDKTPTTTEMSISTETTKQTTTQLSTTQQTTTAKSTTEQSTTTETTVTPPQSTTSDQTSTQKTSTTEQTTQKTTSEQTTTTIEQTTQKTSTTEQMVQETTSEPTTIQQINTSEQTTTEQSISEHPTSELATTSETTTEPTNGSSTPEQQTTSEQAISSTTAVSMTTQDSTDSTTTDQVQVTTEETAPTKQECPETDGDQYLFVCPTSFRRHHKYCNMFYQCTEDDDSHDAKIAMFTCPNNTIYDESKIQCVEPTKAEKPCNGQMTTLRIVKRLGIETKTPIIVGKQSQACPNVGHYPFERDAECSPAFLRCDKSRTGKLQGYIHQCPQGYVYWSVSRRCEKLLNVRDCQLSKNDWSNRWEIPIDSSNIA